LLQLHFAVAVALLLLLLWSLSSPLPLPLQRSAVATAFTIAKTIVILSEVDRAFASHAVEGPAVFLPFSILCLSFRSKAEESNVLAMAPSHKSEAIAANPPQYPHSKSQAFPQ
jgi:hypothetical protein